MKTGKIAILYSFTAIAFLIAVPAKAGAFSTSHLSAQKWKHSDWGYVALIAAKSGAAERKPAKAAKRIRSKAVPEKTEKPEQSTGTEIPEPSNLLMLALGLAGLIAGRYAAKRRRKKA